MHPIVRSVRCACHGATRQPWKQQPPSTSPRSASRPSASTSTASSSTTNAPYASSASAESPAALVADAIEIGARVLDREQTAANAEFVKAEFERAARDLDKEFVERARAVAERLDQKVDEVFGGRDRQGHAAARAPLRRRLQRGRAEPRQGAARRCAGPHPRGPAQAVLVRRRRLEPDRRLPAGDARDDEAARPAAGRPAAPDDRADAGDGAADRRAAGGEGEARRRRRRRGEGHGQGPHLRGGGARGASTRIATPQGDDCEAVGDQKESTGKKGDVLVAHRRLRGRRRAAGSCSRPRTRRLSRPKALEELDGACGSATPTTRSWSSPTRRSCRRRRCRCASTTATSSSARSIPQDGQPLALELAYKLARARVLMSRAATPGSTRPRCATRSSARCQSFDEVRRDQVSSSPARRRRSRRRASSSTRWPTACKPTCAQVDALIQAAEDAAEARPD